MKACGVIVEYNPFHNGHQFHLDQSRTASNADCVIAVMSGNFLQRGEPAIIDKFHRTKTAITQGVDMVVELPFAYAVQNSDIFAKGAVLTLGQLGVSSLCFGSEQGEINAFIQAYRTYMDNEQIFKAELKKHLGTGLSFPAASKQAYQQIGLAEGDVDLSKPNNILGFSYIKNIYQTKQDIEPITIERTKNNFHDQEIQHNIASATSIRKQLNAEQQATLEVISAIPEQTLIQLNEYKGKAGHWHQWEKYFHLLQYRVLTMTNKELSEIHGIEEGLEYRIKKTAAIATNFQSWMEQLKTKRYTWTRLQRVFVHILTNTKKKTIQAIINQDHIPYIRLLGMSERGQAYLNKVKKQLDVPIITSLKKNGDLLLQLEEQASNAYYSIIPVEQQASMRRQELSHPFLHVKKG